MRKVTKGLFRNRNRAFLRKQLLNSGFRFWIAASEQNTRDVSKNLFVKTAGQFPTNYTTCMWKPYLFTQTLCVCVLNVCLMTPKLFFPHLDNVCREPTDSSKGKGERPREFPSGADRTGRCFHTETQKKREKVERTPPNPPPRSTGPAKTKGHRAGASPIKTCRGHFEMLMLRGFKQAAFTRAWIQNIF